MRRRVAIFVGAAAAAIAAATVPLVSASTPATGSASIPAVPSGPTTADTWTGTIPPGAHPANDCP
ncbi:MAG: hypothetical protein QOG65_978, partial [Actinomycetota bacterium]|nr:hypothetical protein [Actinomycetota bacterium]